MVAKLWQKALAESLGTFILVSAVTDATIGGGQGNAIGPLTVATALMVGVYCVGSISGGHLNPAVSFGVFVMKSTMDWPRSKDKGFGIADLGVYTLAQLFGALAGAFKNVYVWRTSLFGATSTALNSTAILAGNITYPMQGHLIGSNITNVTAPVGGLWSIGLAELIYTAVLVFVVLNVASTGDEGEGMKNSYFGLAIGFVLAAAALAIGSISMCCLNPAVAFAIAILDVCFGNLPTVGYTKGWPMAMFLFYSFVELLGALVACGFFIICRQHLMAKKVKVSLLSKFVAEFLGTFVLCLTVMLCVHAPASTITAVGIASSLMVMIYALGAVSGANFNPAVSLGLLITGALEKTDFVAYVVAQLFGALSALVTALVILRRIDVALVAKDMDASSDRFGAARGSWGAVLAAEGIFTFVLVFTVLNTAVRDAPNQYFGLAIGMVVVVGATSLGAISGGCFNPAVAVMLDIGGLLNKPRSNFVLTDLFLFVLIELFAGALAACFYMGISSGNTSNKEDVWEELEEAEEGDEEEEEEE